MSQVETLLDRFHSASSLAVVCHDDPDPDCLAGAMALKLLASESGIDTVNILYGGTISHQQNRAFVNVFDIELQQYSETLLEANELVAFVDHSLPGNHNSVPAETAVDIVIDHHPTDRPIPAEFVDIREEYGATATILTEYIRESPIEMTTRVASGLLFGIHRDSLDFIRQPTAHEYGAGESTGGHQDAPRTLRGVVHCCYRRCCRCRDSESGEAERLPRLLYRTDGGP